jgi:SAM-dependent methyltransferase
MHPLEGEGDIDDPEVTVRRLRIIREKHFLRKLYENWYQEISAILGNLQGPVLEIGSGSGFLQEYVPGLIRSEILKVPNADLVLDARHLPFGNSLMQGIVMVDVFHHIPGIRLFLREAGRCVKPGGMIVMIEPWNTVWSSFIYNYLHHEPFDIQTGDWHFPKGHPLSNANSALPWIVFSRDRIIFEKKFPEWKIRKIKLHTPFSYLLSGGVSFRSFAPGFLFEAIRKMENKMNPVMNFWAMFASIILVKV